MALQTPRSLRFERDYPNTRQMFFREVPPFDHVIADRRTAAEGARTRAALFASKDGVSLKISQDGEVSIYSNGESQASIFNSELPELTTQHSGRPLLFRQGRTPPSMTVHLQACRQRALASTALRLAREALPPR